MKPILPQRVLKTYTLKKDLLDFIKRRFMNDCNWTTGNCLWFAIILKHRFPDVEIYHMGVRGHFIVKLHKSYYDWTGRLSKADLADDSISSLESIRKEDPLYYGRLIRDCYD